MKKILLVIPIIIFVIILIDEYYYDKSVKKEPNEYIIDSYYDSSKCKIGGNRDYSKYKVYYYENNADASFSSNNNYELINEKNIDEVMELFDIMKIAFKNSDCRYSFNTKVISLGDYVSINRPDEYYEEIKNGCKSKQSYCKGELHFEVYFYDIDSHILYYIANNP